MKRKEEAKKRSPYQKPRVEQVELVVEEQVLGGCKHFQKIDYTNTYYCHLPYACQDFGS